MMMTDPIEMWHHRCRPNPSEADFRVQLGCHFEEIAEMLETLSSHDEAACNQLDRMQDACSMLANGLKAGRFTVDITDREDFLDATADQIVTGIGAAYCAGMMPTEALRRVNSSNWSKFDENNKPIRNEHGKVIKGPNYQPPNLEGLY
jgi:predicted HAD superfamily Cof-like phosphohydrolase